MSSGIIHETFDYSLFSINEDFTSVHRQVPGRSSSLAMMISSNIHSGTYVLPQTKPGHTFRRRTSVHRRSPDIHSGDVRPSTDEAPDIGCMSVHRRSQCKPLFRRGDMCHVNSGRSSHLESRRLAGDRLLRAHRRCFCKAQDASTLSTEIAVKFRARASAASTGISVDRPSFTAGSSPDRISS